MNDNPFWETIFHLQGIILRNYENERNLLITLLKSRYYNCHQQENSMQDFTSFYIECALS